MYACLTLYPLGSGTKFCGGERGASGITGVPEISSLGTVSDHLPRLPSWKWIGKENYFDIFVGI